MTSTAITASTHTSTRSPKPRAYVVPVVRPLPPRTAGVGSDNTW